MLYTIPDYYKEFCCTADQCEDTCCAGWQIVIDKKSLRRYKDVKGKFRDRLHRSINWDEEVFRQKKDKRCAFLNESNLCDMYTALGEVLYAGHAGCIQDISRNSKVSEKSHCRYPARRQQRFF